MIGAGSADGFPGGFPAELCCISSIPHDVIRMSDFFLYFFLATLPAVIFGFEAGFFFTVGADTATPDFFHRLEIFSTE